MTAIDFPIGECPHFLDSGAFSLFSRNRDNPAFFKSRDFWEYVDDYAHFIKRYSAAIDYYANVDVIKNPERTYKVQKYIERKHGLQPIPVVHYGDDLKWLQIYLDEKYPYIALGGVPAGKLHFKTQRRMRIWYRTWADAAFSLICDTPNRLPKAKIHGFGVTQFRNMRRYPWFSVDSTAWVIKSAYGQIMVPPRQFGKFMFDQQYMLFFVGDESPYTEYTKPSRTNSKLTKHHFLNLGRTVERGILRDWLREIGVPFGRTKKSGTIIEEGVSNSMIQRSAANVRYYQRFVAALPEWPWPFVPPERRISISEQFEL